MDFGCSPRLIEVKERAAALTERLMACEQDCETHGGLSPECLAELRRAVRGSGLQAINMPAQWGGAGLSVLEQVIVGQELGKLTNGLWDVLWRPANALLAGTAAQRERWLLPSIGGQRRDAVAITEPGAGSDPLMLATTAERSGDRFRLNGEKWFVTAGDEADFLLVLAVVPGEGPTIFLVDKDAAGVRVKRTPAYTHNFVFEHPEFVFHDVDLGPENVLGEVGSGYRLTHAWFIEERLWTAARAVGAAERALALATDWASERVQHGSPIISFAFSTRTAPSCRPERPERSRSAGQGWCLATGGGRRRRRKPCPVARCAPATSASWIRRDGST
jgi:acyl-CoA dehydrogenase